MENDEAKTTELEEQPLLSLSEARDLLDIAYLINALLQSGGNVSRAAEELEIGRRTIYDMMDKYGISCNRNDLTMRITPLMSHMQIRVSCLEDYIT